MDTINVVLRAGIHTFDKPKPYLLPRARGTREVFVTATWELQRAPAWLRPQLFPLLPLHLAPLIIPLAVVSFDYETSEQPRACSLTHLRARARARLLLVPDPRCVVRHPTALLHPAAVGLRGTMAHYIMEYGRAIYRGAAAAMLRTTQREGDLRPDLPGTFGDCSTRDFSLATRVYYIKDCIS